MTKRGIRFGYEVPVAVSYVADAVALCNFQWRFERAYIPERQLERHNGVLICPEFVCVFEVKVSRADFLSTFGCAVLNRYIPVGHLHWVVVPDVEMVLQTHLYFWGVLVRRGGGLHEVRRPEYQSSAARLYEAAYNVLWYGKERPG